MEKNDKTKGKALPKDIEMRLASAGHASLEVTPRVLAQLQKIDRAATVMAARSQEAKKMLKDNEVNVMNLERVISESGDKLTDQTMRGNVLLADFIATYVIPSAEGEARDQLDRMKKELGRCREEIQMLGERDAEVLANKMEIEELRRRNQQLMEDNRDLQRLLREAEDGGRKRAGIVKMAFVKEDEAS